MHIKEISLFNFRNYSKEKFIFDQKGCLITGKNGVGKTNLLEAICFPAFGKSVRQYADNDLVKLGESGFALNSTFQEGNKEFNFQIQYSKNTKVIKLNNDNIKRISELYNYLKIVYFSADDIWLVNGNRQKRRSFFDQAITQSSILYSDILRDYYRILDQRNFILKELSHQSQLNYWNKKFIEKAVELVKYRQDYLGKFVRKAEKILNEITYSLENLTITYESNNYVKYDSDWLTDYLEKIEASEFENKRSLVGPHLDEYDFKINGYSVKRYSSQGQRRSLVISLRFAQIAMIRESLNLVPLIIFDDALSELDKDRVDKILKLLRADHQILIASPNIDNYTSFNFPVIDLNKGIHDENE